MSAGLASRPGVAGAVAGPPGGLHVDQWAALGTTARVVVTDGNCLEPARRTVTGMLDELDVACSRFRPDSEVRRLAAAEGLPVAVSPLLLDAVQVALDAARRTDGDLDPTLGGVLVALGYDRDFAEVRRLPGGPDVTVVRQLPGWRRVRLDRAAGTIAVPPGTLLDLGATAKAWAADRCAVQVAAELGCGVLVSLGGDIATAGPPPEGGWVVDVRDRPDQTPDATGCRVCLPGGGALATSSTGSRSWVRGHQALHHIVSPRTLRPAEVVWRYVTVAAATCLEANVASTAAILRGRSAPTWLAGLGLPARLVGADGRVCTLAGWPAEVAA